MTDPTALPAWVDEAAATYLKWGSVVLLVLLIAALVICARAEVRRAKKKGLGR